VLDLIDGAHTAFAEQSNHPELSLQQASRCQVLRGFQHDPESNQKTPADDRTILLNFGTSLRLAYVRGSDVTKVQVSDVFAQSGAAKAANVGGSGPWTTAPFPAAPEAVPLRRASLSCRPDCPGCE
jgi:hypothetical protein